MPSHFYWRFPLATMATWDKAKAVESARSVRAALHGFVTLEMGAGFGIPLDLDESFARLITVLDRGLGPAADDYS